MKKFTFITSLVIIFLLSITTGNAQTRRYVKAVATGTGDGSSWANASSDLQAIINASARFDEIWVAKGTYRPTSNSGFLNNQQQQTSDPRFRSFIIRQQLSIYGGFSGTEISLGQRNYANNKTILSGDFLGNDAGFSNNGENAYHVVFVYAGHDPTLKIDGFTITGGNSQGMPLAYFNFDFFPSLIDQNGAGLAHFYSGVTVNNCIFTYNNSGVHGGAVSAFWGWTSDFNNCLFLNNHAAGRGGAVHSGELSDLNYFNNCTFFGNSSAGATINEEVGGTSLSNSIVWGNNDSASTSYRISAGANNIIRNPNPNNNQAINSDPMFSNASDPDGADNILGNADDGLIPLCGPAIGGGINTTATKDLKNQTRILNGTIDMGPYETSLIHGISSVSIYEMSNHSTSENLPGRGYCQGKSATFGTYTTGNGGSFQWKQNGINVGANSNYFSTTSFQQNDVITLTMTNQAGCVPANVLQSNALILQHVSNGKPVIPTKISGPVNACPFINGAPVAYTINKAPGTEMYLWYYDAPAGSVTITHPNGFGPNDTTILVAYHANFTMGSLYVSAENYCGISSYKRLAVYTKIPQGAGTITGPTDVCPYVQSATNPAGTPVTYSIRKVIDASSYVWTVPAEATILSHPAGAGFNDTVITVRYNSNFVTGSVTVQGVNFCGSKPARSILVSKKAAGTPGTITGPTSVCAFKQSPSNPTGTPVVYTIKKVLYATSYTWTLPAGASATHPGGTGLNDTLLSVIFANSFSGGAITVKANSNCNVSAARSLSIIYKLPYTPGTITAGTATACPLRRITYSIPAIPSYASSVLWSVPPGGTIISGQGTPVIVVQFSGITSITDTIRVVGVNDCGTSPQRKLKVGVLPACRAADNDIPYAREKTAVPVQDDEGSTGISVMPNPTYTDFKLHFSSNDKSTPVVLRIMNGSGSIIEMRKGIIPGQSIKIGSGYQPGVYFAEFIQGLKRKNIKLVRL
jgi:predicted outer membrane repeat protein